MFVRLTFVMKVEMKFDIKLALKHRHLTSFELNRGLSSVINHVRLFQMCGKGTKVAC